MRIFFFIKKSKTTKNRTNFGKSSKENIGQFPIDKQNCSYKVVQNIEI
jgi:hypothetical protein